MHRYQRLTCALQTRCRNLVTTALLVCIAWPSLVAATANQRVIAVVTDDILPTLRGEIERWQADLRAEGWDSGPADLIAWDSTKCRTTNDNADIIQLWQRLRSEYLSARGLRGVMLVGTLPLARDSYYNPLTKKTSYWENWDYSLCEVSNPTFDPNPEDNQAYDIWVARVDPYNCDEVGAPIPLIKRYFDRNHAMRSGRQRVPARGIAAIVVDPNQANDIRNQYNQIATMTRIYGAENVVDAQGSNNCKQALLTGGMFAASESHGKPDGMATWGLDEYLGKPTNVRNFVIVACHEDYGHLATKAIFGRHSAMGFHSYGYWGCIPDGKEVAALAAGNCTAEALLGTHSLSLNGSFLTGDPTLVPTTLAHNDTPTINAVTVTDAAPVVGQTVLLSMTAQDRDGYIERYEWFPQGYWRGTGTSVSGSPSLLTSYARPHTYVAAAFASDNFMTAASGFRSIRAKPIPGAPLRIDCGKSGPSSTDKRYDESPDDFDTVDATGRVWLYEESYSVGHWGLVGKSDKLVMGNDIALTDHDQLYRTFVEQDEDNKPLEYAVTVPNGHCSVRLLFQSAADAVGQRRFDVSLEDSVVDASLDLRALAGATYTAVDRTYQVTVSDGVLNLSLMKTSASAKRACLAGIEIIPDGGAQLLANAGPDQVVYGAGASLTLPGFVSLDDATALWTATTVPTGASARIEQPSAPNTTVTLNSLGTYVFTLTAAKGAATHSDTVTITCAEQPANAAPAVSAGPDRAIGVAQRADLAGIITDDGYPLPQHITASWAKVSGPGTVSFLYPDCAGTLASFSATGSYVLRLTGDDGALSQADTVTVVVTTEPPNQAPKVEAGDDRSIYLNGQATLAGSVSDDGKVTEVPTITWSKVSGPGVVTFANADAASTTASFTLGGTYVLQLTANDGALSSTDTMTVNVSEFFGNEAPKVEAGDEFNAITGVPVQLRGSWSDDGLPNDELAQLFAYRRWQLLNYPAGGTVTFADDADLATNVTFNLAGTYTLQLAVSDGDITTYDFVEVGVTDPVGDSEPFVPRTLSQSVNDSSGPIEVGLTARQSGSGPISAPAAQHPVIQGLNSTLDTTLQMQPKTPDNNG